MWFIGWHWYIFFQVLVKSTRARIPQLSWPVPRAPCLPVIPDNHCDDCHGDGDGESALVMVMKIVTVTILEEVTLTKTPRTASPSSWSVWLITKYMIRWGIMIFPCLICFSHKSISVLIINFVLLPCQGLSQSRHIFDWNAPSESQMQMAATNWWSIGDDISAVTRDVEGEWVVEGCRKRAFFAQNKRFSI